MKNNFLLLILLFFTIDALAQHPNSLVRKGNASYTDTLYSEAEQKYREALMKDQNSYAASFNLADAIYKQEKFSESTSLFWKQFADQASWYSLAGIKRHSDIPFWNIDNFGWHSDFNEDTFFTKSQLYDNVQLLSSNFNVTELKGETEGTYNINKVKYYNVINRHFAGGQKFKKVWYKNNLILLHIYFWNPIRIISLLYNNYFYRLVGKIKSMINKNSI